MSVKQTTERMTRRTRTLDIHGLSRSGFEGLHPLPEKPEEPLPMPPLFTHQDSFPPPSMDGSEHRSSSSLGSLSPNTDQSSSIGTGYITTGRSSAFSWGKEDEFDREASQHVRKMFDNIDNCLFEHEDESIKECTDWNAVFPFIRVVGQQVLTIDETGTQIIPTCDVPDSKLQNNEMLEDVEGYTNETSVLSINGKRMETLVVPRSFLNRSDDLESPSVHNLSYLEEEVFAIDGEIEEFIAYDYNASECYSTQDKHYLTKKKHAALPPVTPHLFVRETIISECFDQVWLEIVGILKNLLRLYIRVRARKEMERQTAHFDSDMDRFLESALELPHSRDSIVAPSTAQRYKVGSGIFTTDLNRLNDLMTIRSVALKHRAPSVTQNLQREVDPPLKEPLQSRPASSSVGVFRQFPKASTFRAAEQQFYDRMSSAKAPKRSLRLQPLQPPKTAGHVELNNVGEVRGTRLQTNGDQPTFGAHALNQQIWGTRNGVLPPLDRLGTADTQVSMIQHVKSPKRQNRASSAVSNESKNVSLTRDRLSTLPDSRPNTTLSYLTDQPSFILYNKQRLRDTAVNPFHSKIHHQQENLYNHSTNNSKSIPLNEEQQEFEDLVLWGHGPPLISHQQAQKNRKSIGGAMR